MWLQVCMYCNRPGSRKTLELLYGVDPNATQANTQRILRSGRLCWTLGQGELSWWGERRRGSLTVTPGYYTIHLQPYSARKAMHACGSIGSTIEIRATCQWHYGQRQHRFVETTGVSGVLQYCERPAVPRKTIRDQIIWGLCQWAA